MFVKRARKRWRLHNHSQPFSSCRKAIYRADKGVLNVMNDETTQPSITKTHTRNVVTFHTPTHGPLGNHQGSMISSGSKLLSLVFALTWNNYRNSTNHKSLCWNGGLEMVSSVSQTLKRLTVGYRGP